MTQDLQYDSYISGIHVWSCRRSLCAFARGRKVTNIIIKPNEEYPNSHELSLQREGEYYERCRQFTQIWEHRKLGAKCREAFRGTHQKESFRRHKPFASICPKEPIRPISAPRLLLWLPQKLQLLEKKDVIYQILRPKAVISRLLFTTLAEWLSNFSMPLVCWIFPSGRVVRTLQEKPSSSFSTSTALGGSNVSNVLRILSYPSSWKFKSFKEKLQLRFPFIFTPYSPFCHRSRDTSPFDHQGAS